MKYLQEDGTMKPLVKVVLQKTDIVLDTILEEALGINGSMKRLNTKIVPLEDDLSYFKEVDNITNFGDVNNFGSIERTIIEAKSYQTNLYLFLSYTDFSNTEQYKKDWILSNCDIVYELSQDNNSVINLTTGYLQDISEYKYRTQEIEIMDKNIAKKMTLLFTKTEATKEHASILDCEVEIKNHKSDIVWMDTVQFLHDGGFAKISEALKEVYIKDTLDFHPLLIGNKLEVEFDTSLNLIKAELTAVNQRMQE